MSKYKSIKRILKIYGFLTNRKVNLSKSAMYLPPKFNVGRKLKIKDLMTMDVKAFHLIYLGVPISYRQLSLEEQD